MSPRQLAHTIGAGCAALAVLALPVPSVAQDNSEARLRKIEAEIRALQRNVFPGGDGRFFEPQISPETGAQEGAANTANRPSTTAVTDILARLDAMEAQLQRLTAVSEEQSNAIALMDERITAMETAGTLPDPIGDLSSDASEPAETTSAVDSNLSAQGAGDVVDAGATSVSGPSAERLAAVQAITKPQTDDAGDDEYSYGFRLWDAGFYPEARQQLTKYVKEYPSHFRVTYGRNLLGRAYLDDGMPEDAARWFLRNYQADKTARRAPDSLLFLAESMIELNDTTRACIALAEFAETYPAVATGRLADQYQSNRQKVTCT
ncbi:tol-pal system YbgF family protein [Erythrobacter sp. YT30]|uniref:tetratricopeptide repeat protein n=1 Tax=Erythrobacter sp. YT30 TaxID=1735012 RepID=UPI00076D9B53|nr:tetratricopeptide repeat protein [Erythrobacter sp. YT30]KWV90995.1 hypothetical protein AUC45_06605 [Erythrobacter sp. YT30]